MALIPRRTPGPIAASHENFEAQMNLAVEARLNTYLADPGIAALTPARQQNEIMRRATGMVEGGAVPALLDPAGNVLEEPRGADDQGLRQRYGRAVANRTDSVIGFRTKRRLNEATWQYSVEEGVRGAIAFAKLQASARRRGEVPAVAAQQAREMSLLNYVRADENEYMGSPTARGRNRRQIIGEGSLVAQAVADERLARVDRQTAPGRFGAIFDRAALRYGRLSRGRKIAVGVAGGLVLGTAAVLTAGSILGPVGGAVAGGLASGARSAVTARLENRDNVLHAEANVLATSEEVVRQHDRATPMAVQETVAAFNTRANKKNRGNRYKAAGTAAGVLIGMHIIVFELPGIDRVVDGAQHAVDKVADKAGHAIREVWDGHFGGSAHHPASGSGTGSGSGSGSGAGSTSGSGNASSMPKPKAFKNLNVKQASGLKEVFAQGNNSYHDMRIVQTPHGAEVVMESMKNGQTIINGHVVDGVPHGAEVFITEHTPTGNQIIEVPLGETVGGHLKEVLLNHDYVRAQVVTQQPHGIVDVFATSNGKGLEVAQGTFTSMTHDVGSHAVEAASANTSSASTEAVAAAAHTSSVASTETAAAHASTIVEAHLNATQLHELATQYPKLYDEFAIHVHGENVAYAQQLFSRALTHAFAAHQLELVPGSHGSFQIFEPIAGSGGVDWQPATNAHIVHLLAQQLEEYTKSKASRKALGLAA
jgi:hypothetical protein